MVKDFTHPPRHFSQEEINRMNPKERLLRYHNMTNFMESCGIDDDFVENFIGFTRLIFARDIIIEYLKIRNENPKADKNEED